MKFLFRPCLYIVLLCLSLCVDGQELVMNGNFETINYCTEFNAKCSPAGWFFVNQQGPRGFLHQDPKRATSGKEYLDFMVAAKEVAHRTYWQTMLICPLVKGEEYEISFNIAARNTGPNLNDIGFLFSDQFIHHNQDTVLQPENFLAFTDATVKKRGNFWFGITKRFVATTNQRFLVIGNFSALNNDDLIRRRRFRGDYINLELDDVSIQKLKPSDCPGTARTIDSIFAIRDRHPLREKPEATATETVLPPPRKIARADIIARADTISRAITISGPDTISGPGSTSIANSIPVTNPVSKPDTIRLGNILFAYDSHILKDTAALLSYKELFSSKQISSVMITGFADDRGSGSYNLSLSLRRAHEVMKLIAQLFSVDPVIMKATGAGKSNTFSARERNRRVEIYIYYLLSH